MSIHSGAAGGRIPVLIAQCILGLAFTTGASLIAIAQLGTCGRPGPENTAKLAQALDHLLNKNQELLRMNPRLRGKIGPLRNHPVNSRIPVKQVRLDRLTEKNYHLRKKNKQLLAEIDAVRSKLVAPTEASTTVNVGRTIAKIAAWPVARVRGELR
jgi:hypothetical protein